MRITFENFCKRYSSTAEFPFPVTRRFQETMELFDSRGIAKKLQTKSNWKAYIY